MGQSFLLDMVRQQTEHSIADYIAMPSGVSISDIIVETGLGERSGLFGAFALAQ